jgi:2-succinyl-6-hydroxy-2,4-cyclohexadiene-1-carboxylate synthase
VLHADRQGDGPPVVLVHGFTQTAKSWPRSIVARLAAGGHEVIAVDAPGHGGSGAVRTGLPEGADLITATLPKGPTAHPATWIGYSMGGRFALYAAIRHPEAVGRLVLVSTTAGIEDDEERAARRQSDETLAVRIEREGVDAFVEWWLRTPLFAHLPPEASGRQDRLTNTAAGLASSLRLAGAGTMDPPLWTQLHTLRMPVLIVAGEEDRKYAALAARLADHIGTTATTALIAGAGHACHLEQPDAFIDVVDRFLQNTRPH